MSRSDHDLRRILASRLPGRQVGTVRRLGQGLDNVAYEVDGSMVVRVSKEPDPRQRAAGVVREAELLRTVPAFSSLPVPEVVFVDEAAGMFGYRKLPGTPLLDHRGDVPATLAPELGRFLTGLHRAPPAVVEPLAPPDTEPLQVYLDEAIRAYEEVADVIPDRHRPAVESFLGQPPPPEPAVRAFSHNDLGAEHILVDRAAVTGVIDWSDAAITDPAHDLGLIFRDFGATVFDQTLRHYDVPFTPADRDRAAFYARCAVLEDIAYGVGTAGAQRYADAGLAHLEWTFADPAG